MNKQTIRSLALLFYILVIFLPLIVFFLFPMPPGQGILAGFFGDVGLYWIINGRNAVYSDGTAENFR